MGVVLAAFAALLALYCYFMFRRVLRTLGVSPAGRYRSLGLILGCFVVWALATQITSTFTLALLVIVGMDMILWVVDFLLRHILGKEICEKHLKVWNKIFGLCIIPVSFVIITFIYGYYNIHHVVETHYEVTTEKELKGDRARVCFLSDVHCSNALTQEEIRKITEEISAKDVDLVILGGDLLDNFSVQEDVEEMFRSFGSIRAEQGIYYIFGNHDRTGDYKESVFTEEYILQQCRENGIRVLKDESVFLEEMNITLVGREDASTHYGHTRLEAAELLKNTDPDSFVLVADHEPTEYQALAHNGADLVLGGHLHAGQILPANLIIKLTSSEHVVAGRYLITGDGARKTESDGPAVQGDGTATAIVSSGFSGWGFPIKSSGAAEYCIIDLETCP